MRPRILLAATIVIILCSLSILARAENLPTLSLYVNDLTNPHTLLQSEADDITYICLQVDNMTTAEIAVLIVNSTQPLGIDMYAAQTFQLNGIGKTGQDNGVLILVSIGEKLWRIEVGYGLEGILNDAKVGAIGRSTLSVAFETGDYYNGIFNATLDIGQEIVDNYQPPANVHPGNASLFTFDWRSILIGIVIFLAVAVLTKGKSVIWIGSFVKRRGFGGGGSGGGGADGYRAVASSVNS